MSVFCSKCKTTVVFPTYIARGETLITRVSGKNLGHTDHKSAWKLEKLIPVCPVCETPLYDTLHRKVKEGEE